MFVTSFQKSPKYAILPIDIFYKVCYSIGRVKTQTEGNEMATKWKADAVRVAVTFTGKTQTRAFSNTNDFDKVDRTVTTGDKFTAGKTVTGNWRVFDSTNKFFATFTDDDFAANFTR